MSNGTVDKEILSDVVRRIVEVAQPEKIILFGSAARGEMGPHSDLDLLVIRDCDDKGKLVTDIYRSLPRDRNRMPVTEQDCHEAVRIAETVVRWAEGEVGHRPDSDTPAS